MSKENDFLIFDRSLEGRSEACLLWGEPNPLAVIEVVSPGAVSSENYQRDYVQKPKEYADGLRPTGGHRGIPEFWQIDPSRECIKVGVLISGLYEFTTFQGETRIVSPTFPNLNLTAIQILNRQYPD